MFVVTGFPVRYTYSILIQGTDTVVLVQVITVPKVVLSSTATYLVLVEILLSLVVATESLVMAHTQ